MASVVTTSNHALSEATCHHHLAPCQLHHVSSKRQQVPVLKIKNEKRQTDRHTHRHTDTQTKNSSSRTLILKDSSIEFKASKTDRQTERASERERVVGREWGERERERELELQLENLHRHTQG